MEKLSDVEFLRLCVHLFLLVILSWGAWEFLNADILDGGRKSVLGVWFSWLVRGMEARDEAEQRKTDRHTGMSRPHTGMNPQKRDESRSQSHTGMPRQSISVGERPTPIHKQPYRADASVASGDVVGAIAASPRPLTIGTILSHDHTYRAASAPIADAISEVMLRGRPLASPVSTVGIDDGERASQSVPSATQASPTATQASPTASPSATQASPLDALSRDELLRALVCVTQDGRTLSANSIAALVGGDRNKVLDEIRTLRQGMTQQHEEE